MTSLSYLPAAIKVPNKNNTVAGGSGPDLSILILDTTCAEEFCDSFFIEATVGKHKRAAQSRKITGENVQQSFVSAAMLFYISRDVTKFAPCVCLCKIFFG